MKEVTSFIHRFVCLFVCCVRARVFSRTHERANDNHRSFSGNRCEQYFIHVCARRIVMHNTVFISLYHSICVCTLVHQSLFYLFTYLPTRSLFHILHLPIEDHGQTSSSLSIVCILQWKNKQKQNKNESRACARTHSHTLAHRIFSEFHCIHMRLIIFSFFSPLFFIRCYNYQEI